jgi:hypothetical protein
VLFYHTNSAPASSHQYFSLTTNQHQPPATGQPNEALVLDFSFCCMLQTKKKVYIDRITEE